MLMELNNEKKMIEFVEKNNYLVVFPDKGIKLFQSLRKIENEICVSASTISKKLKNEKHCICQSKGNDYLFYIKLLN